MTQTVSADYGFGRDRVRRAVLFGSFGAFSGLASGAAEWSGVFAEYYLDWPIPGTQSVWYLAHYSVLHGFVFGALVAVGLLVLRIAEDLHIGPVIVLAALAAFVSSNVGINLVQDSVDIRSDAALWVLSGVAEGGISTGILMAALAAMIPSYRHARHIAAVVFAGAAAGGVAIAATYVGLYAELDPAEDSAFVMSLPFLIYMVALQGAVGVALGAVSTPPGPSENINCGDDIVSR